jgi:hypothetical protein
MRTRFTEMQRTATDRAKRQATEGTPMEGLKPWREIITPHPDVCSGTFAQAEFAADLAQVHRGDALPEYGDAREFFRRTYLTEGLRGLLLNALQRFAGKGGHPVIELQTNFGGGKTHSMLALHHLVGGVSAANLSGIDVLMADAGVTILPSTRRAVLVGTALSAGQPETAPDGRSLRTLWGRMAYQLGGAEAYAMIEPSDQNGAAPGSDDLVRLFKHVGPCLILIDEWVAYCRQMYGTPGLPGGSFDANLSFAQALTEAVKATPTALLVASLPQSAIEVGGEGGAQALARLESTFGRLDSTGGLPTRRKVMRLCGGACSSRFLIRRSLASGTPWSALLAHSIARTRPSSRRIVRKLSMNAGWKRLTRSILNCSTGFIMIGRAWRNFSGREGCSD